GEPEPGGLVLAQGFGEDDLGEPPGELPVFRAAGPGERRGRRALPQCGDPAVQDVPPYGSAAHEADGRHRVTSRRTVAAYWQRPNHMTLGSAQKCPLEASSGASTGNVTSRVPPAGTVQPWMTSGSRSLVPQGAAGWASPRILRWVVFVSRTVSVVRSPGWRVNVPVSVVAVRPVGRASVAVVPRTASAGSGTGPGTGTSGA